MVKKISRLFREGPCDICKKKPSMTNFAESVTDLTHGHILKHCRKCHIVFLSKRVKGIQKTIAEHERLLAKETKR